MLKLMKFTEEHAKDTIQQGYFPDSLLNSAENLAIILTQDWCPQWKYMEQALNQLARAEEPRYIDIFAYVGIYNLMNCYSEFMNFKENVLGNQFIPYICYYKEGKLIGQSNFVAGLQFLAKFTD
ncbi:MAG: hypothetical protein JXR70_17910 [Spirochaetales bacterium]|nr:hypothetical protein [Spirochaetales bacterium]